MNWKETLIKSTLAGIAIGIGGVIFLSVDNKVTGALLFTLGLFTICTRGYFLFTGKIGYVLKEKNYLQLVIIWLGNLLGTNLTAILMTVTRVAPALQEKAAILSAAKTNDSYLSLFVLGIFCNILMYVAVDGFRTNTHEPGKYLGLFLCVGGFILCGFEHCIADMFYFGMAGAWNVHTILCLLVITAGNITGGLLLPLAEKK
ncbi:MAG: formate/nitrite transporter family protein [Erysipelotrichaceae bacterium]|nr:formate/nitrite transporter family protein [Erysipelotrichaceae bacterium]